ncbi:transcription initiation factor TFIID subunit 12-like [Armigeres subalbatus]|uniref:transcription initiation factor TFIID subunit 12-like n=1 Tax=Armigeres subalbatus TaxID=124917 RepID=UPI002ED4165F
MRVEVPVSTSASTATIIPSIPDADIPPALVINEGPIPTIIECNEPQIIPSNTCLIAKDTNLAQTITTAIIPANSIATNHATPATPSASIIASTSITAQQQQLQATLAPSASIILRSTDKCTQTESSPKPQRPRAPAAAVAAAAVAVSDVSIHPSMSEAITANTAVSAAPVLPSMNPATFSTTATVTNPTPSVQQSMTPLQHDVIDLTNATSSDGIYTCNPLHSSVSNIVSNNRSPHTNVLPSFSNTATNNLQIVTSSSRPQLAIAPPAPSTPIQTNSSNNWYYLTRFLPHETEANIINYIARRANCNPNQVICHKLWVANYAEFFHIVMQLTLMALVIIAPKVVLSHSPVIMPKVPGSDVITRDRIECKQLFHESTEPAATVILDSSFIVVLLRQVLTTAERFTSICMKHGSGSVMGSEISWWE